MINQTTNNNTWDIRKQTLGHIMFLNKKRSGKMKAKGCTKGCHHRECNHKVESSSLMVPSYALLGSCLTNTMDYNFNYKLWSVIGRADDFTANKWMWYYIPVRAKLL